VNQVNRLIVGLSIAIFIAGCTINEPEIDDVTKNNIPFTNNFHGSAQESRISLTDWSSTEKKQSYNDERPPNLTANVEIYDGQHRSERLDNSSKKIKLSVDNIEIPQFTKLIFSQILGYNFVMDSSVENSKKTVTLNITEEISKKTFLNIVNKLYVSNGFYTEYENNTYYIKKGRNQNNTGKDIGNHIIYGRDIPKNIKGDDVVSVFIPYHYVYLLKIKEMFQYFLSKNAFQKDFRNKNVYLIRDHAKNLRKVLAFIKTIDVPVMKKKITKLYKFKYIDVEKFYDTLEKVLPSSGVPIAKHISDLGIHMETITQMNALFVVSDKKKWIKVVEYWKRKLDIINVHKKEPTFFVYRPKNRISTELKDLLNGLFTVNENKGLPIPKEAIEGIENNQNNQTLLDGKNDVKVIDDKTRNMLIIYATPKKYKLLLNMLRKLDVLPKQVLIEVTIAELTLKDSLEHGFEWYLKNNSETGIFSTLGGLGLGSAGLSGAIINSSRFLQLHMNFFAQKNLINILSSPKIVVVDNQPATLNVGTDVPILTSSSNTVNNGGDETLSQSVEYRKTGIILNVTPTIHSNNSLMLKITQTVSEAQANSTSNISSPIVLMRNIDTNVVLKSGQTLMLGGLIRKNTSTTDSKVPILGDIPYVGELFKTSQESTDKTELIILIKPIVLDSTNKANSITDSFIDMFNHNRDRD